MEKKLIVTTTAILTIAFLVIRKDTENIPGDKVTLGRQLFFDPILSSTRKISCASCHKPEFAFADSSVISPGVYDRKGTRNTPSAMNLTDDVSFFWDGRAATLEEQALLPIASPHEMDLPVDSAVTRLNSSEHYRRAFRQVFGQLPDARNLAQALAGFQRSLETADTPFDDWRLNDNADAVSESVKRGFAIFNSKARCFQCHFGPNFNNTEFRNIGLFDGKILQDSGRASVTGRSGDLGKFKIGPLRNVALTAPYMHNGMFRTLREVIDYYDDPDKVVPDPINRDSLLSRPLNLTEQEKTDLENFLRSLTDRGLGTATPF